MERVHNLITDFIYKIPEKIKDMRNRNEEIIRLVEDSYNQGGLSFSGAPGSNLNTSSFYYSNQASLYHRPQNQENVANNHDFEDFLNLVSIHLIYFFE